jgi:hypothetical protein
MEAGPGDDVGDGGELLVCPPRLLMCVMLAGIRFCEREWGRRSGSRYRSGLDGELSVDQGRSLAKDRFFEQQQTREKKENGRDALGCARCGHDDAP